MRLRRLALLLILTFMAAGLLPQAAAAATDPAATAELIRAALFTAQAEQKADPARAAGALAEARSLYTNALAPRLAIDAPESHAGIMAGLAAAEGALSAGDPLALADARAQVWTGLLGGSLRIVEQALPAGDSEGARTWLRLREFRAPTRLSRPRTDATAAVERFHAGALSADETLVTVSADLLDTYQERLRLSLQQLQQADEKGLPTRQAEHASLAAGYFAILAPAYKTQRGPSALADAQAAFGALRTAARSGQSVASLLPAAEEALHGFRAAPLSPEEQRRRAGQLRRFLGLVPVEYERGVSGGQVTKDFEIHEAITFRDGAEAAFADLQTLLEQRDAAATNQVAARLADLQRHLADAVSGKAVVSPAAVQQVVREIDGLLSEVMPAEWLKHDAAGDFDAVAQLLDQMERAAAAGQYDLAESARLEAYAMMETGPEPRLVAFAPQYIPPIESLFWHGSNGQEGLARLIAERAPLAQISATRDRLDTELAAAQAALSGGTSPVAVTTNSGLIVFREGLEAVLILASLMAGFQRTELRRMRRPLWWGSGASLLATALTWVLARGVLVSLARYGEKLEAVVSVIAVAVLLLITNWFFHKSYWTDWLASFHAKKKGIVANEVGQWIGLATLGFTSVYREGFETVLFLQALVLEAGNGPVLGGVALGMAGVLLVGVLLFSLQVKLPYKKMLIVTGIFIGSVLLTMVGKLVHSFQVVGWLPTHPLRSLDLPYWSGAWFGVYATWEGLALQMAACAFVIGSYVLAEWMQRRDGAAGARPA
jgi:high-affinity iron transporter